MQSDTEGRRTFSWSPAVRYGRLGALSRFLIDSAAAGAISAHFDVLDGRFASGFGVGTDLVRAVASESPLPLDLHVQAADADALVPDLINLGCATVLLHVETLTHAHRALSSVSEAGVAAGLAISASTPLTALEYLLPFASRLLLVARDPDVAGGALPATVFERVKILRENIDYHDRRIALEVEGVTEPRDIAQLVGLGADRIVIEDPGLLCAADLGAVMTEFIEEVRAQQYVA